MKQSPKNIAIVGSGLIGALLAIYLRKAGHKVTVFDRRPDIRTVEFSGRSINLAMSDRGWKALEGAGIDTEVRKIAIPCAFWAANTVTAKGTTSSIIAAGENSGRMSTGVTML